MPMNPLEDLGQNAANARNSSQKLFNKLKKTKSKLLDEVVHDLHEETFRHFDCLACANCCKTTSPIFYQRDIERLSRHFRMKPSEFIAQHLHVDEDKDYVLNSAPCPFLGADNFCSVYESRPTACKEYPHTDRKRFHQILDLTLRNAEICPAVFEIVEKLKKVF